jgi:hypothetical protein
MELCHAVDIMICDLLYFQNIAFRIFAQMGNECDILYGSCVSKTMPISKWKWATYSGEGDATIVLQEGKEEKSASSSKEKYTFPNPRVRFPDYQITLLSNRAKHVVSNHLLLLKQGGANNELKDG